MTLAGDIFYIFFREDLENPNDQGRNPGFTPSSGYIDRITGSGLFIFRCTLWKGEFVDLPMKARLGSGVLFVAGMVTFITPASFGTDPLERSTGVELLFVIVALFPSAGYMVFFWMLMLRCFVKHRKICNLRQQTPSHRSDDSISQGEQSEQWAAITEIIIFSWPLVVPEFAPLCRMFKLTNGLAVSLLWSIHFSNSLKYFFNTWTGPRSLNAKSINGIDQVQIQQATFQDHFPQIQVYNNLLFLLHHNLE